MPSEVVYQMMHFELSEEHKLIRQTAREFADQVLLPGVIERDEEARFPFEEVRQLAELGFMGMMVSRNMAGQDWIRSAMCWPWRRSRGLMRPPPWSCP